MRKTRRMRNTEKRREPESFSRPIDNINTRDVWTKKISTPSWPTSPKPLTFIVAKRWSKKTRLTATARRKSRLARSREPSFERSRKPFAGDATEPGATAIAGSSFDSGDLGEHSMSVGVKRLFLILRHAPCEIRGHDTY